MTEINENVESGEVENNNAENGSQLLDDLGTNKYLAIVNWINEYRPVGSWTFFNVVLDKPNTMSVNSVGTGRLIEEFVDGTRECEFLFSISLQKKFDAGGTTNINVEAIQEFENISRWIEEKNSKKEFPTFADNENIEKVEVMDSAPTMTVDENNKVAKYLGQFKITYMEE